MVRHRLEFKITSLIVLILTVGLGVLTLTMVQRETRLLLRQGQEKSNLLASSVVKAIQNVMLQGRADIAARFIDDMKALHDLERLQIFRTDGKEAFHDLETFQKVKFHLSMQEGTEKLLRDLAEGIAAHRADQTSRPDSLDSPAFREVVQKGEEVAYQEAHGKKQVITYLKPLRNEVRCYRCHGADHRIRGVLAISSSLEGLNAEIRQSTRALLFGFFLTIVFVGLALRWVLTKVVVDPIGRIAGCIREIAGGNLDKVMVEVRARDEIGELAENLNKMAKDLRQSQEMLLRSEKLSALGQLASGVAHEINNPLATIAGYTEDILDRLKGQQELQGGNLEKVRSSVEMVHQQAYRCRDITRNLLNFARKEEFRLTEVDVNALIEQTIQLVGYEARMANKRIVRAFDRSLPQITSDPSQLQQVFLNIMKNALDAIGEEGEVRVATQEGRNGVVVEVSDTGCGIRPEHLDKIFDPFFTTKPPGVGTGLGLAISYRIIDSMGGDITVQSRVGEGTTFTVALPTVPYVKYPHAVASHRDPRRGGLDG